MLKIGCKTRAVVVKVHKSCNIT